MVGFTPANIYIFKLAFHHKSTLNNGQEQNGIFQSNERLEYLGDALLSFIIGEYLFTKYPTSNEGFLTKMRSKIVKRKMLNQLAIEMGMDIIFRQFNNTRISSSMLGNAFEALVGAVYLEKGLAYTREFVLRKIVHKYIDIDKLELTDDNYKSQLLEWCQKNAKKVAFKVRKKYKVEKRDKFSIGVMIDGVEISNADDFNKKNAEQIAAELAIQSLGLTRGGN